MCNDVSVPSKSNKQKTKIAGSGAGSVRKRYGSADPDPCQNITAGTFVLVSSLVVCNATPVGGKKDGVALLTIVFVRQE